MLKTVDIVRQHMEGFLDNLGAANPNNRELLPECDMVNTKQEDHCSDEELNTPLRDAGSYHSNI